MPPDSNYQPDATIYDLEWLKLQRIWMCAPKEGGKNPINPHTGFRGSPTDPACWGTYAEAMAAIDKRPDLMLGVALGPIPGSDLSLVGVDIDKAASEGKLKPFAQKMYDVTRAWLYELSRSKHGLHGYALIKTAALAEIENRKPPKKHGYGLEFYVRERYFIWTEVALEGEGRTVLPVVEGADLVPIIAIMDEFEALREDIYLAALTRQQMVLGKGKKGRINIRCPWFDGHTTKSDDTETIYWPSDGIKPPGFKCMHAHCEGKGMKQLIAHLKKKDEKFVDDLAELAKARRAQGVAGPEFYEAMIGQRFVAEYGDDYRYVSERKQWFQSIRTHWQQQKTELVTHLLKQIAIQQGPPGKSGGIKATMISGGERMARSDPKIAMTADQFDAQRQLFNHLGGTLDTLTLQTREHRKEDYITVCAPVVLRIGSCPMWNDHMKRIMAEDAEMIAYLQRLLGYCLTGETGERVLFNFWGGGHNGKSVLLATAAKVMGEYAYNAPSRIFTVQRFQQHAQSIAMLEGKRLVFTSEVGANQALDIEFVKRFTGGSDPITANKMRENDRTFYPQGKLVIAGNHKLVIRRVDEAIKQRLHLVPFTVQIPAKDRIQHFEEKLFAAEGSAILGWMYEGLQEWRLKRLSPPKLVLDATDEYLSEQDTFGLWQAECCEVGAYEEEVGVLYRSRAQWCEQHGERVPTSTAFGDELMERGFGKRKSHGKLYRLGLRLKPESAGRSDASGWSDPFV